MWSPRWLASASIIQPDLMRTTMTEIAKLDKGAVDVTWGVGGCDGRARSCVATAFKIAFELGDPAGRIQPRKKCSDSPMTRWVPLTACRWRVNMKTTFRLSVLVLLLVLAVLSGALRGSGPAVAGASGQLAVLDWPGYDEQAFWIDFKNKHPDVTVNFEIGSSDADIYGKIKAGSQADIFHPYTSWLQDLRLMT